MEFLEEESEVPKGLDAAAAALRFIPGFSFGREIHSRPSKFATISTSEISFIKS